MRYLMLLLLPILLAACSSAIQMEERSYEGRPHFLVKTKALDYYYDIRGGGFSRIIDREGNDWVSFKMEPWGAYPASAASSYRGLPNLVFQGEDGGAGHPGHDQCRSTIEGNRILTESLSKLWLWSWEFFDDHAILKILRTDPDRFYWFLYEGAPGGGYDPQFSYYGSDQGGPFPGRLDYYKGDILWGQFQWMYAGSEKAAGSFFMVQPTHDNLTDMISFLGNTDLGLDSPDGMTVFGFGRGKDTRPLMSAPQSFVIGLYPSRIENQDGHQQLSSYIEANFLK
jgi:hypothetical protein